jgi:hypothetical protein
MTALSNRSMDTPGQRSSNNHLFICSWLFIRGVLEASAAEIADVHLA